MPTTGNFFSVRLLVGSSGARLPGDQLREYALHETVEVVDGVERRYVSCFVPSQAGQRFYVRIKNEGCTDQVVSARLFIDGQLQYKGILRKPGDTHHVEGRVLSTTAVAPFLFTKPTFAFGNGAAPDAGEAALKNLPKELKPTLFAHEEAERKAGVGKGQRTVGTFTFTATSIGEIRCEFWKIKETRVEYGQPSLVFGTNGLDGKAGQGIVKQENGSSGLETVQLKEGEKKTALVSHTVGFGSATVPLVPVGSSRVHSVDADTLPWIVHSFRYRSQDLLDAEGLTDMKPVMNNVVQPARGRSPVAGPSMRDDSPPVQSTSNSSIQTAVDPDEDVPIKTIKMEPVDAARLKREMSSDVEEVPVKKKKIETIVLSDDE